MKTTSTDAAVRARYSEAARTREAALCCPVDYDPRLLDPIPARVIERDYGCGDPSRYVRPGDRVLDLGSGSGKIAFMAGQLAGADGRVIGVDENPEMLALARGAAAEVAGRIGFANVEFRRGRIQDLGLDLDRLDAWLLDHPINGATDLSDLEETCEGMRARSPLIPSASVDLVVSNCVLNLVRERDKRSLIREIHRVLAPGGRIAVSDIVSDDDVPDALRADPTLWSGCVSGAFHERVLLEELARAGFHGLRVDAWVDEPFAVVGGIEFRSVTVTGCKLDAGPCLEAGQAILYRGPWRRVEDDDGHVLERGVRTAVCAKTFDALTTGPWSTEVVGIEPSVPVPEGERRPFDCARTAPRSPRETGADPRPDRRPPDAGDCC